MGCKLLLADDSITIQKVVGIIFANEDYDLTVVGNGTVALEKAREIIPDIILADALMPGNNGYEVCEEVRKDPALSHIPLLLMTGAFEPFDEDKARRCGADDFITKPFESQHLITKVKTLLDLGKERTLIRPTIALVAAVPPPLPPQPEAAVTGSRGQAPGVQPAPAVAEPTTPPAAEEFFTVAEEGDEDFFATELTAADEVVEVSAGDDLWGAFDNEEVPEAELLTVEEPVGLPTLETVEEPAGDEIFFMETEEPAQPVPAAEPSSAAAPSGFVPQWEPVTEETFSFEEEAPSAGFEVPAGGEPFAFEPPGEMAGFEAIAEPVPTSVVTAMEQQFAPEEEYVPVLPPPMAAPAERLFAPEEEFVPVLAASPAASEVAPAAAAGQAVPSGELTLSEEQLATLLAKVSRDIIEKIAWEVVPDLAENIIRAEIRKIKEGK